MSNDDGGVRKSKIAIFTCAVTDAVHLERVSELSARAFLSALKRFVGQRGIYTPVYFDNVFTFKRASRLKGSAKHVWWNPIGRNSGLLLEQANYLEVHR